MEKLMRSMGDMPGMPGMSMYSREDLAGMKEGMGGGEYDGEEEEEEAPPPPPRAKKPAAAAKQPAAKAKAASAASKAEEGVERVRGVVGSALASGGRAVAGLGDKLEDAVEVAAEKLSAGWAWLENSLKKKEDL